MRLTPILALLALSGCAPVLPPGLGDLARSCSVAGGIEPDTATGLTKPPPEVYGRVTCKIA